ncbi:hypothetical protein [Amycolatopsis sp. cmx-4-54]
MSFQRRAATAPARSRVRAAISMSLAPSGMTQIGGEAVGFG